MATDTMHEAAARFFEACETGQGWARCSQYGNPDATSSAQGASLEGVELRGTPTGEGGQSRQRPSR